MIFKKFLDKSNVLPKIEEGKLIYKLNFAGYDKKELVIEQDEKYLYIKTDKGGYKLYKHPKFDYVKTNAKMKHGLLTLNIPQVQNEVLEIKIN